MDDPTGVEKGNFIDKLNQLSIAIARPIYLRMNSIWHGITDRIRARS